MKHRTIILPVFFSLIFIIIFDVNAQIKIGAVVQDKNGVPIPYASVFNSNSHRGCITNEEGRFELNTQAGDTIVIRCLGYSEYQNTAEQIQKAGIVVLNEAIYNLDEVNVTHNLYDVKPLIRKFHSKIRKNYPTRPIKITGVYKEYSQIENEYYGFLQCDVDILFNSMASFSRPSIKTKVHDYKFLQHQNRKGGTFIELEGHLRGFWLFRMSFLWNFKEYQHSYLGSFIYNGSIIIKIKFYPKQINESAIQFNGIMYIDSKTSALIFLRYELLSNERDFYLYKGLWQKAIKGNAQMMFEFNNGYYFPAYEIRTQTSEAIISDWEIKPNNQDTISVDFVYNFFTKNVEYKPKGFEGDSHLFETLTNRDIFDQSKDYKSDFILETEQEKQLMESKHSSIKRHKKSHSE